MIHPQNEKHALPRLQIAVLEPSDGLRDVLVAQLGSSGLGSVAAFASAPDLERGLQRGPFDVLVVDLDGPASLGLQLCSQWRRAYPGLTQVAISARHGAAERAAALNAGADHLCAKPVSAEELVASICRARGLHPGRPGSSMQF